MANITIKESIINHTKDKYYFHINDLKKYFKEKENRFEEDNLKRYPYKLLNKEYPLMLQMYWTKT